MEQCCFLIQPGPSCLGTVLPVVGWSFLHQFTVKRIPYRHGYRPVRSFFFISSAEFFSQRTLHLCQVDCQRSHDLCGLYAPPFLIPSSIFTHSTEENSLLYYMFVSHYSVSICKPQCFKNKKYIQFKLSYTYTYQSVHTNTKTRACV